MKQAAAVPVLPYAIEHPYEHAQRGTGGAFLSGAGWGAGIGALGGAAIGALAGHPSALRAGLGGALFGGVIGGSLGAIGREAENWSEHAAIVRDFEAKHGLLPYELSHARNIQQRARLKGQAMGMAADTAISGNIFGISDRDRYGRGYGTSTYGLGQSMGAHYGELSAREQFDRALIDYKRGLRR